MTYKDCGAQERTRTFTGKTPHAPEACASTNSATWAIHSINKIHKICEPSGTISSSEALTQEGKYRSFTTNLKCCLPFFNSYNRRVWEMRSEIKKARQKASLSIM